MKTRRRGAEKLILVIERQRANAMYQLKGGEEIRDGKLYGWTGRKCPRCGGAGAVAERVNCYGCAGTGEEWGLMPIQPAVLPSK